nr:MAG TPA: transposase-like protein [Caudoviricetes sp.]
MRLIDADELKKRAVKVCFPDTPECGEFDAVGVSDIDIMPTIEPESLRPTAKWIVTKTAVCGMYRYECSSCGALRFRATALHLNYCSNCGKRMVNADD